MENDKHIKVTTDKRGKEHISVYKGNPRGPHDSIHINIDTKTGKGNIVEKTRDGDKQVTETQCYLTTACMQHYAEEFDDNCYELATLRWFRDTFVSKEDIAHYYQIAPAIVEAINKIPECEKIYSYIYVNIIDECIKAIEQGDYEFAYSRYKNSVLSLQQEYVNSSLKEENGKVLKKNKLSYVY